MRAAKKAAQEGGQKVDVSSLPFSSGYPPTDEVLLATECIPSTAVHGSHFHANPLLRLQTHTFEGSSIPRVWQDGGRAGEGVQGLVARAG
jgi:hypothetical protein